jgi:hypothetical protein
VELILPIVAPVPELGDLGRQSLPPVTAAGQYYLFTVVRSAGPYAQPEDLGRQGLWDALKAAYRKVLMDDHPCHCGPVYGKVARELHAASPDAEQREPHLHAACAFGVRHRWKAVESVLRLEFRVKARCLF